MNNQNVYAAYAELLVHSKRVMGPFDAANNTKPERIRLLSLLDAAFQDEFLLLNRRLN